MKQIYYLNSWQDFMIVQADNQVVICQLDDIPIISKTLLEQIQRKEEEIRKLVEKE